jgi:hypothetical protein
MTDFLGRFGAIVSSSGAGVSADVLDFGAIDPRAAMQNHRTGEQHELTCVFHTAAAITGAVTPKLQDSDDNSTFADLATGQAVTNPKIGPFAFIPMPKMHKRYVRAALTTTASSSITITAFLEPGPEKPVK